MLCWGYLPLILWKKQFDKDNFGKDVVTLTSSQCNKF